MFALAQHHKWDITSLENLHPFEVTIYLDLLIQYIKEQKQKQQLQQEMMF